MATEQLGHSEILRKNFATLHSSFYVRRMDYDIEKAQAELWNGKKEVTKADRRRSLNKLIENVDEALQNHGGHFNTVEFSDEKEHRDEEGHIDEDRHCGPRLEFNVYATRYLLGTGYFGTDSADDDVIFLEKKTAKGSPSLPLTYNANLKMWTAKGEDGEEIDGLVWLCRRIGKLKE